MQKYTLCAISQACVGRIKAICLYAYEVRNNIDNLFLYN